MNDLIAIPEGPALSMAPVTTSPLSVAELLAMCWRRRYLALMVAGAVALVVFAMTMRITPLYEAKAKLEVLRGRAPVKFGDSTQGEDRIEFSLLNTQRDRILASPVLSKALKTSGLETTPGYVHSRDKVERLRGRLKVNTSRDSWVIEIALRDENQDMAKVALQGVLTAYFGRLEERDNADSAGSLSFLTQQVDEATKRLVQAQQDEQVLRRDKNIITDSIEDSTPAKRLKQLNDERLNLDRDFTVRQALLDQVTQAQAVTDPTARRRALLRIEAINKPALVQLQAVYDAEATTARLAQSLGPKHPQMREQQGTLEAKRHQLDDAIDLAASSILAANQELALRGKLIDDRIAIETKNLGAFRSDLIQLRQLSQVSSTQQKLLDELQRRLAEEQVVAHLDSRQVAVNDPPEVDAIPVNRRPSLFAAAALFLGLVAGIVAVIVRESLERLVNGLTHAGELTQLPLLVAVPAVDDVPALGSAGDPISPPEIAEAYRTLRAALRLIALPGRGGRCLVVTSAQQGDGKSTVASRLAVSLAAAGHHVLLVDADLRHPALDAQFGIRSEDGLTSLLAGEKSVEIKGSPYPRMDYLGVGLKPLNPGELLHGTGLTSLISQARQDYDYVIFDTPPLSLFSDALILCSLVDGIILVLRDRHTARSALTVTLQRLQPLREKLLGFVFNASHEPVSEAYKAYSADRNMR